MRKLTTSSQLRKTGRAALLTSAAALAVVTATPALAQSTVVLQEGSTVQGDVKLDGADRLVLDISRLNGNTGEINLGAFNGNPELLDGNLTSAAGADTVWLRATSSKTANVAWPYSESNTTPRPLFADAVQFTGGVVYEASGNDTVLTLENRSRAQSPNDNQSIALYDGPLRFAGDGVIDLTFSVSADQAGVPDRAIVVEKGSSALGGDGRLDLRIRGDITAFDGLMVNGELDPDVGVIDARNAASVTFKQQEPGYGGAARMAITGTTGVLGGKADILVERLAYLAVRGGQTGILIRSSGNVVNKGRLDGTGNDPSIDDKGIGVFMEGANLLNTFTEGQTSEGIIYGGWAGVVAASGDNFIDNGALIQSRNAAGIETRGGSAVTRNRSHTLGSRTNAGRIIGGFVNGQQIAYQDIGNTQDLIVNSSTITGDVLMGGGSDTFLYTGANNGVTGKIDGGDGDTDAYGVSVSTSGPVTFANDLNSNPDVFNFEMHGLELNGSNLNASIQSANSVTLANGVKILGSGTVTNNAKIDDADGYGILVEKFEQLDGRVDLINAADISARFGVFAADTVKSFRNTANIAGGYVGVGLGHIFDGTTLDFVNEGVISSSDGWAEGGSAFFFYGGYASVGSDQVIANLKNSGTIRDTYSAADPTNRVTRAVSLYGDSVNGTVLFENIGTVETTGTGGVGVIAGGVGFEVRNSNIIQALGAAGGGVLMSAVGDADRISHLVNTAAGKITANGGGFLGGQYGRAFAFGVGAQGISNDALVQIDNAGVIEATGANSIAVAAIGIGDVSSANFTLNNTGTIRGGHDTIVAEGEEVAGRHLDLHSVIGDTDDERIVAGAIQTWRTTDLIRNAAGGSIIGSIDLGLGNDRFENYGTIDGNVRMGDGNDTFVLGTGTITAGHTVRGGIGEDVILADLSDALDKMIDGDVFYDFDVIRRMAGPLGAARLFVRGDFGGTMLLDDVAIHIALNDMVSASGGLVFQGGNNNESIFNAGTIGSRVAMGAGDDVIENTGTMAGVDMEDGDDSLNNSKTINGDVLMGKGNDEVVNSGTINGKLDLGDGDDRYESLGAGIVRDGVFGGDGIDTLVFKLQGATTSVPGGFDSFESFAAFGPGTLKLDLTRTYDTLEILEGANLELTNAANFTVKNIIGDEQAQSVKIDAGFNGSIDLKGGDDTLEMSLNGLLAGDLKGGAGNDTLKLNLTGASTLTNLFGFEDVRVAGASPLTLAGTLDADSKITFGDDNNEFIIAENAVFNGSADGGSGSDTLRVTTGAAASRTIVSGQLTSFESLYASGAGTLEFSGGNHRFNTFQVDGGNVAFMNGAKLAAGSGSILFTGNANNRFTLGYGSSIGSRVDGGDGDRDVLEFNQGAGQTQKVSDLNAENFEILAASGAGYLNIDQDVTFTEVQIEGGKVKVLADVTLTADVVGGAGDDTFDNAGKVDGDIDLGDGDDTYVARTGSSVTGQVHGGVGGNDTVVYSLIDGAGTLLDDFIDFESLGVYGPGTLSLDMQQNDHWNSVKLLEGANLDLKSSGGTIDQIIGDDSSQTVTVDGALTGGVDLGGGDDTLNLTLGGVLSGNLDGGAGDGDVLNLKLTSESRINGMYNFETANISGGHALTLGGALGGNQRINFDGSDDELIIAAGAKFEGTVDGGAGQNLLRVQSGAAENRTVVASQILNFQDLISEGAGMLALTGGSYSFDSVQVDGGSLELGANTVLKSKTVVTFDGADNRLVLGAGSTLEGGVDGGAGNDTLAMAQAQGQVRTWSTLQAAGFERLESSGAGELRFDVNADFINGLSLNGGVTTIAASATLTADVTGGDNADSLAILGVLNGDVDLGAGDDRLIFAANGSGLRQGGSGTDTLEFRGANASLVTYDASLWDGFEKLAVSGGTLSMTGVSDWQGLTLTGGRLVGQAGSVITSSSAIEVGAGSVFGSAGTVNADINVRGTLSPGASPGTMTVNGDVSFLSGSNLLMELSPQASDLLKINGAMNIASGATIDITGVLPSTPGQVLDLIVASDGINGRFTTINKSSSVFGFVSQNGNKLQIRGEFQNNAGFGSNARNSINYANAVLGSGQAVQAFTQAVPVLVDANGVSNAAAFAQLTPEAYGSAMAMQTETALSGVDAGRSLLAESPRKAGKFAFARGYGASTELEGRASTGAASADIDLGAAYAGVGYVSPEGGVVGGFVGFTNSEQSLRDLGADTKSDGMIAGAFLGGDLSGVRMGAQMTYERSDAETSRLISAAGGTAKGEYDMESVAIDASMSYPIQLSGWTVAPTVGATWISARRDAVSETGATSFDLTVDQDRSDTLFTDIGVRASTVMSLGGAALTPFAELGVRTIQNDGGERVTGTLKGVNGFEMDVDGVRRDRSVARVAAGVSYDLGSVRLDAGYAGEFGDTSRHNFGAGVSVRF